MKKRWLALALAACGGSSERPDAATPDVIESNGSVTVIVTDRGNPVAGLPVFFQSADGVTTFSAVTSVSGSSGFDLADGFVTVLLPKGRFGVDQLSTFAGVRTNDILHLDLSPRGPQSVELDVTVNADAPGGPMLLYSTCGGEQPFGVVAGVPTKIALQCTQQKLDLLAVRIDPDTDAPVSSQFLPNIDITAKTVVFAGVYSPVASVPISYTNPNNFNFVYTAQTVLTNQGRIFESVAGGDPADPQGVLRPTVAGARLLTAASGFPLANQFDEQVIYTAQATGPDLAISLAPRLPPYTNTGEFRTGKLVWSEAGGNMAASLVRGRVKFYRDDIPAGTAWSWQIVAPRGPASEVAFPVLPVIAAFGPFDFNPIATDTATIEELTNIRLPGTDRAAAYNQARPNGFADVSAFAPQAVNDVMIVQRRFLPEPVE